MREPFRPLLEAARDATIRTKMPAAILQYKRMASTLESRRLLFRKKPSGQSVTGTKDLPLHLGTYMELGDGLSNCGSHGNAKADGKVPRGKPPRKFRKS